MRYVVQQPLSLQVQMSLRGVLQMPPCSTAMDPSGPAWVRGCTASGCFKWVYLPNGTAARLTAITKRGEAYSLPSKEFLYPTGATTSGAARICQTMADRTRSLGDDVLVMQQ
jgi:hypothetical protein